MKQVKEYTKKCNLEEMRKAMDTARRNNQYFVIFVNVPGCEFPEMIINHPDNLLSKSEYYKNAYNDDCELKVNNNIRILDYKIRDNNDLKNII